MKITMRNSEEKGASSSNNNSNSNNNSQNSNSKLRIAVFGQHEVGKSGKT